MGGPLSSTTIDPGLAVFLKSGPLHSTLALAEAHKRLTIVERRPAEVG